MGEFLKPKTLLFIGLRNLANPKKANPQVSQTLGDQVRSLRAEKVLLNQSNKTMKISKNLQELMEEGKDEKVAVVLVYDDYRSAMGALSAKTDFQLSSHVAEAGIAFGEISVSDISKTTNISGLVSIELDEEQLGF